MSVISVWWVLPVPEIGIMYTYTMLEQQRSTHVDVHVQYANLHYRL